MIRNQLRLLIAVLSLGLCVGIASCHKDQPHSVSLTWRRPPTVAGIEIVGYNVYRRVESGGPFVKIASQISVPQYEDRLVLPDRTYVYAVTALDSAGRESRFSSEVRARIP